MIIDSSDLSCGDIVVLNTEMASVRRHLSPDGNHYIGFYKTVIPASRRPSSGWRRWLGPRRVDVVGLVVGSATNRDSEKFDRAFVLWDGEILEARCNHLRKVVTT